MSLEIEKTLVLSTAHISRETVLAMDNETGICDATAVYPKGDYGWWLFTRNIYTELPLDLAACLKLALDNDCGWLCLDRDGNLTDQLPTYEW